jgi:hypothetical protein
MEKGARLRAEFAGRHFLFGLPREKAAQPIVATTYS